MRRIEFGDCWRIGWATLIALVIILLNTVILRAEPIKVTTESGRTFTGEVDPRSNAERLWLRSDREQSAVYRPIDWQRITAISQGERSWKAAEFQTQLDQFRTPRKNNVSLPNLEVLPPPLRSAETIPAAQGRAVAVENPGRVTTLQVEAYLSHFGTYVNADGLQVHVYPLDEFGRLTPVAGTLEVELLGVRPSAFPDGREFGKLGRWVKAIQPTEFSSQGAVVRLPFQAEHPEFNLDLAPKGIVHARFTVAGDGVFDASTPAVRIRAYNPIRDRLQLREGERYFSNEWTSRGDR